MRPRAHHRSLLHPHLTDAARALVQVSEKEQNKIGMVVIRGNSVVMIEALEKLWGDN